MQAPLYLARSGGISGDSLVNVGGYGYYWSSTVNNSERARRLDFGSSNVLPENNVNRYGGFSVRCVLREFTYSVPGTTLNDNGIDLLGGQNVGYTPNAFTTIMNTTPLYFIRSGYLSGTTLYLFGAYGAYWSSTVNSSSYAYHLYFSSTALGPANRSFRNSGRSVRCLSR